MQGKFGRYQDQFDIEIKRDENSKAFGQTVKAKMEYILYDHGIDNSGAFGGAIDGNDYCQLMYNAESIFGDLMDFVLASHSSIDGISGHQIKQVCAINIFFLQALDGYISGMLTKIFHLTDNISENTRQYRNKCMELERYL